MPKIIELLRKVVTCLVATVIAPILASAALSVVLVVYSIVRFGAMPEASYDPVIMCLMFSLIFVAVGIALLPIFAIVHWLVPSFLPPGKRQAARRYWLAACIGFALALNIETCLSYESSGPDYSEKYETSRGVSQYVVLESGTNLSFTYPGAHIAAGKVVTDPTRMSAVTVVWKDILWRLALWLDRPRVPGRGATEADLAGPFLTAFLAAFIAFMRDRARDNKKPMQAGTI
ncbi:MAG TPA: hypothetical protein V6C81_16475 [Planktothrix sp.]|jgi:hypothetical protein